MKEEDLAEHMRKEVFVGGEFRCGVLGELGCSWPLEGFERRVLRAAAALQSETPGGLPVIIHPGRHPDSPREVMDVFLEAGGIAARTVMSHLERTVPEPGQMAALLSDYPGLIGELDLFGIETSYYQLAPHLDMPSDAQRIAALVALQAEGLGDRLTVAHDIHTKHRLARFGGHGFAHVLENAVPRMRLRGLTQETIDHILLHTPRRWLAAA